MRYFLILVFSLLLLVGCAAVKVTPDINAQKIKVLEKTVIGHDHILLWLFNYLNLGENKKEKKKEKNPDILI